MHNFVDKLMDKDSGNNIASGNDDIAQIASRHGFSVEATREMLDAVVHGRGAMAQFRHTEFGGFGQWMRGGMVMVGDMFNHSLKARVDALCNDLAQRVSSDRIPGTAGSVSAASTPAASNWWPSELGSPASAGSQNAMRYAWFPQVQRLVVDANGQVSIYDTGEHRIGGVSQQQSGVSSVVFTSQYGPIELADLPLVGAGLASD